MTVELRACCRRPACAFYSTPDRPRDTFHNGETAPVLAVLDEPPEPEPHICWHEAAHACAMHAAGASLEYVTIRGQPEASGDTREMDLAAKIMMLLAGPAASDAHDNRSTTLFARELSDYFDRVDALVSGDCDQCRASLAATVHANRTGRTRDEIFREGERMANKFVRDPRIQRAIRALAAQLTEHGTVNGEQAHSIMGPFIKFGEMKLAEENQEAA